MSLACSKKAGATSKKACRASISAKSPKWTPLCSRCSSPGCATPRRATRKFPLPTFPHRCRRSPVCTAWSACCPPPRRTTERHRCQAAREALRRRARARGREPRDRAGRVLRPARPQWRRQDDPHQRDCRLGAAGFRGGKRDGRERGRRLPARAAHARRGAPGAGVRPVLHGARDAAHPVGLLRHPGQRRLDRRGDAPSGSDGEGQRQHARALRRHEAPRAGRAGAGAQTAGDRARRADRGCRRGAAAGSVAVRAPAQPRGPHDRAHHALPRGGRTALQSHRAAQSGPHCRARLDAEPARNLFGPAAALAARCGAAARGVCGAGDRARRTALHAAPVGRPRARGGARWAARERHRHHRAGSAAARPGRSVPAPDRAAVVTGFRTLFFKELLRFWKVSVQTVAAPVLTALLYLIIFGHALEGRVQVYEGVRYTSFLVPGLVMMSVLQNSFANSSSSLIQSKITGNIVFILLSPVSHLEFFGAYVLASVIRGLVVGAGVLVVTLWFVELRLDAPLWAFAFALLGAALLGALGLLAGILSEKIDQLAAFQNFVIVPLTFLAGVFYSIHSLSGFWQKLSHANPFFYMVDGFRYGFFGASDVPAYASLAVVGVSFLLVSLISLWLLKAGYKLRV